MKKIVMFSILSVLSFSTVVLAAPEVGAVVSSVADKGNKICPVSNEPVSGKTFEEYKGKRYGLCCRMCAKKFEKDPEKYIADLAAGE